MIYLDYTVKKIKKSATKIFYEKGFNGARVIDIAQDAEVSKSLLHYYFRTKEQLFKIILDDSINLIVTKMSPILEKDPGFFELIDEFIYQILTIFKDNKNLLSFIINEYNQNFDKIKPELKPIIRFFKEFEDKMKIQSQKEGVKITDTKNLIVNMISLCGWQVIGINIFNMEKINATGMNSADIRESRKYIYESIIRSLNNH